MTKSMNRCLTIGARDYLLAAQCINLQIRKAIASSNLALEFLSKI